MAHAEGGDGNGGGGTGQFALLIIDPQVRLKRSPATLFHELHSSSFAQVDFHGGGSLAVPGADEDAQRIQAFVAKHVDRISNIFVTLDSHQVRIAVRVGGKLSSCTYPLPHSTTLSACT